MKTGCKCHTRQGLETRGAGSLEVDFVITVVVVQSHEGKANWCLLAGDLLDWDPSRPDRITPWLPLVCRAGVGGQGRLGCMGVQRPPETFCPQELQERLGASLRGPVGERRQGFPVGLVLKSCR